MKDFLNSTIEKVPATAQGYNVAELRALQKDARTSQAKAERFERTLSRAGDWSNPAIKALEALEDAAMASFWKYTAAMQYGK